MPPPIASSNSVGTPMPPYGALIEPITPAPYYNPQIGMPVGSVVAMALANQVAGLVPVFPCSGDDCRWGLNGADSLKDPRQFALPVFAQTAAQSTNPQPYFNDTNAFLFYFPGTGVSTLTFTIDKFVGGVWVPHNINSLNTYGTYYPRYTLCPNKPWVGTTISWYKVLNTLGEGIYRFKVQTSYFGIGIYSTCFASPPFCLKTFSCLAADRTTKFESYMSGGILGNVDKSTCGGQSWEFCCTHQYTIDAPHNIVVQSSSPIQWYDSIRVAGEFGYEDTDYERKIIKYTTGVVNKIRDEALLKFKWTTQELPFWFHERFKVYGLFSDQLLVSDYNIYQSDYNLKRYCVIADGAYNPQYHYGGGKPGGSQYSKVDVIFKPQTQYLIRNRCCASNISIPS